MRRVAFAVVAMMLPFSFAACGAPAETTGDSYDYEHTEPTPSNGQENLLDAFSYIKKVDVEGVPCVVFRDGDMGGVSCGW